MPAKVSIEMQGAERLGRIFSRATDAHRVVLGRAIYLEANRVLNESKRIVPFRDGHLKDSGEVSRPQIDRRGVEVEISYGGAATPYAAVQHWDTSLNHPNGKQALYLLTPVNAATDTFVRKVMETFARYIKKG